MTSLLEFSNNINQSNAGLLAIQIGSERLTYEELNIRVNQLSSKFNHLLPQQKKNVCICLPKELVLYIAILATLKSGNCYVPVEYITPIERLDYFVHHSTANMLITKFSKIKELSKLWKQTLSLNFKDNEVVLCSLNKNSEICEIEPIDSSLLIPEKKEANFNLTGDTPAYLLYTSGSTGFPKGILHHHTSASTFVDWATNILEITSHDRVAQHAPVCFDLSVFDIFSAFKAKAALLPVPEFFFGNMKKICKFIQQEKITVWYSVPSVFLRTIDHVAWAFLKQSSLRHIVFAGENIPVQKLRDFSQYIPEGCRLHNWYGPTETNVCTHHEIMMSDILADTAIPIGQPCPYAKMQLQELKNELFISSGTMMLQYWNDQEKTDASFTTIEGETFYKTGDIVHLDNKKNLVLEGRYDRQCKVKGYRIQLEEIEHVLVKHPNVNEAYVIPFNRDDRTTLIAFYSAIQKIDHFPTELEKHCARFLPQFMIPEFFFERARLPRNSRSKIDQKEFNTLATKKLDSRKT